MPYVNIKVTDENVTPEQKSQLIKGVTDLLFDVLGKAPDSTYVVIDEVALTDWGVAGVNVAEYRAQRAARG
ncbi:tautomerase family protein [Nocardia coubleae]|uniref:Tautomerase n=1 Tax=Nocardia coubleae TaxID=356147 RepID=A0A846W945_9NOCA|nr:4-oxalocrotonate tautomerase family protein [Nocardia coubleae]NKX89585.1 4-oxalocrotonate tautomerase family protein [Nocardia coubleae]